MSLIFGYDNPTNLKVSEAVSAKGLNKLQARPSDVTMYAIVQQVQIAYKTYSALLPAFMRATAIQQRTDATQAFHPVAFDKDAIFPMPYPDICLKFGDNTPSEIMDRLKAHGYEEVTYNRARIVVVHSPTTEIVQFIMTRDHNKFVEAPQNTVNTSCLAAIMTIKKIFSNFFVTQHYPAFTNDQHASEVEKLRLFSIGTSKRKAPGQAGKQPKRTTRATSAQDSQAGDEDMDDEIVMEEQAQPTIAEAIRWCHPSPLTVHGWGDATEIPSDCDGVFAPFIAELAMYDATSVLRVITDHFLPCLGADTQAVRANVQFLSERLGVVSKTQVGLFLAHMARCIHLAITGQGRCFPVFEGDRYHGCAILGAKVRYVINKEVVVPVSPLELKELVQRYGNHKSAMTGIFTMCGASPQEIAGLVASITCMSQVRKVLLEKASLTEAQRDEILKLASQLRFGPYRAVNPDTIDAALSLIADESREVPLDLPIHHSMLFERDRVAVIWSSFGDVAPSPAFPGKRYALDKSDHPIHIGFRTGTPLRTAIADLRQVLSTKQIAVPPLNRKSAPYAARIFTGADGKRIWVAMSKAAGVNISESRAAAAPSASFGGDDIFKDF